MRKITKRSSNEVTISSLRAESDNSQQFLGLDSFAMSPIVNNAEDGPFVCETETGNEFNVYSYKGKGENAEQLSEGTYITAHDNGPDGFPILLVIHRALGRQDRGHL